jgi:hypothetical protein
MHPDALEPRSRLHRNRFGRSGIGIRGSAFRRVVDPAPFTRFVLPGRSEKVQNVGVVACC